MLLFKGQNLEVDAEDGTALLKLDVAGKSVNVLNRAVLAELDGALDAVAGARDLRLLVLRGMKKTGFLAGADIQQFTEIASTEEAARLSASGQALFDKVTGLYMPTLAVIHGPCLGGGLELALACDYRLVVESASTQLGLPEVELGLLPGWGGTQRLPRVVGLERALTMILTGKRLSAIEAFRWGLADAIARTESELRAQLDSLMARAIAQGKRPLTGLPLRTWRQWFLESTRLGRKILFLAARKRMEARLPDDMPAPWEALEAVEVGLSQGMQAGLAREREGAARLATSAACRNLVNIFLQREKTRKPPTPEPPIAIQRVGVVGAGVMGAGIAQLALLRNYQVVVQEINESALGMGLLRIKDLFQQAVNKGILSQSEADRKLGSLTGTVKWEGFAGTDLVIEAAAEDLAIKRQVFQELEKQTRQETILASNTSSLAIASLQEGLKHPERVAGLHFFNPVHKMPLVEVARAPGTTDAVVLSLMHFATTLGKSAIEVRDSRGLVVNRVLMPYVNEAILLVNEGLDIAQVDGVMRRFGMPVGPLEMVDQVGLDVAAHVAREMEPAFGDRFAPNPTFQRIASSGWLGVKRGAGFYRYRGTRKLKVNRDVLPLLRVDPPAHAAQFQRLPLPVRLAQARERMVLLTVNEAAACLGEQLVADAQMLDLAMILGSGWAPHRGGPLRYADTRGLPDVVAALRELESSLGPRFRPCLELNRRAEAGNPFYPA